MYQDAFTHSGVPDPYPLGLSGPGDSISYRDVQAIASNAAIAPHGDPTAARVITYARKQWAKIQDENWVTSADYQQVERLLNSNAYGEALVTIQRLEANRPKKKLSDKLTSWIPAGYGVQEQLIQGVPNWVLYASGGLVLLFSLRRRR